MLVDFIIWLMFIWICGGIITNIVMFLRSCTPPIYVYTYREYLIGFIGSWYTLGVLSGIIKDE
jgi:ABC-type transport system involved in multi-copper enzyme maturation permease subunit